MALIVKDRVKETTTTTGTGTITLAGAEDGFQSFAAIGNGNTTYYAIISGDKYEVGLGTYTLSGTTLSRTTILESSNSGSAITLSGTSDVFCTYPAEKAVTLNGTVINDADVVSTANIVNDAVTTDKVNLISTGSVPSLEAKGTSGVTDGYIQLNCAENSHGIKLKSPPHSAGASYTLTFPNNDGDASQFLQTNGSGVMSWATAPGTPFSTDIVVNSLTVGKGNGSVATSTALGVTALQDITGANNTAIGYEAMKEATSASSSVAVGRGAMGDAIVTGTANTALGYTTGKAITSGAYNTLVGHKAGLTLNTGASNVMIGNEAGDEQTGSLHNTVIGAEAGQKHTSGYSVMIGSQAGKLATSATELIAIGRTAGGGATMTGNQNICIGKNAGAKLTTGYQNTFIGNNGADVVTEGVNNNNVGSGSMAIATTPDGTNTFGTQNLAYLTTGNANDAFGANALYNVTTGYDNVGMGNATGTAINTGFRNTALGHEAGQVITTGSNNTLLGYAATPSSATVSNEFTLGNSSVGALRCQQTSISALSDARDKTDIVNSPYGLAFVDSLKPRQFKWESRDGKVANDGETKLGFIAQELLEATNGNNDVLDLVYENNPEKLEAKYGNLIPVLVKAIQELSIKVKELESK